jgi:RNA polymerase sigma-70 factor (ECF subfamily)
MAGGDSSGLADLYDRHGRAVFSLAFRITGDRGEAEDVCQDVFTQAWSTAVRYDARRGAVAAWLLIMTRTRAIYLLRRRRSRPQPIDAGDAAARLGAIPDASPDVDLQVASAEEARLVKTALADLPEDQRDALTLAYFEGLSHAEIADRTGTPLGTIKTRIRTGLLKLRDAMGSVLKGTSISPFSGKEAPRS